MKKFLIVKTSSIGDVIQTFHLIDYLKYRFPKCEIDWVVEKSIGPLLNAHPQLNTVLEVDTKLWRRSLIVHRREISQFRRHLRKKNYDVLFDLQGNTKSGMITALAKAEKKVGFGWNCLQERTNYFSTNVHLPVLQEGNIRSRYLQLIEDFFGKDPSWSSRSIKLHLEPEEENRLERLAQFGFHRPRLMICFGSNWKNKTLPFETLKRFLELIHEKLDPSFFFIFGNEEEKKIADQLEREFSRTSHSIGEMSLPLWQRFMDIVEGVIAMDSAALHLCATTETPSFSLFGPSSSIAYKPLGNRHWGFQGTCPFGVQFDKRCPHLRTCERGACLREVSAEKLFSEFQVFWTAVSKSSLVSAR